jgi:hypothetical protein
VAISHVQDATSASTTSTVFSLTGISTTGGHLLTAVVWTTAATSLAAVTDSAGNPWTLTTAAQNQNPPANQNPGGAWFTTTAWAVNTAAVTSVTVTLATSQFGFFTLSEWAGAATQNAADTANSYQAPGTQAPSVTTNRPGDLLLASCIGPDTPAAAGTGGWTVISSNGFSFAAWLVAGAAGNYSPAYTGNTDCCGTITAFAAAGAQLLPFTAATLNAASGSSSYTATVSTSVPAGTTILAGTTTSNAAVTVTRVTDSRSDLFTLAATAAGNNQPQWVWAAVAAGGLTAGTDTVTMNVSASTVAVNLLVVADPSCSAADIQQAVSGAGTSATLTTSPMTAVDEHLYGFAHVSTDTPSWVSPQMTQLALQSGNNAGFYLSGWAGPPSPAPVTVTTSQAGSVNWTLAVVTLMPPSAPPASMKAFP